MFLVYLSWIAVFIVISALPYILFDGDFGRIAEETITDDRSRLAIAAIGIVLLVADLFLVIPSGLIIALLSNLLGTATGVIIGAAGLSLACVLGYWIGKTVGRDFSNDEGEQRDFGYVSDLLARHGLIVVAACRPIPVLGELSVIASGAIGLSFAKVFGVSTLANIGVSSLYASIGVSGPGGAEGVALVVAASLALPALTMVLARLIAGERK
ncbi:hypothetical protein W911_16755 [Hyphomicrobium nitrativorans NL23]|uniref:VTT domain-containing protein n=2 Tax=Hyphomicrobium TaxID=81 RepID=V5SIR4_9HYPH|nr:hypothetical protein W911_16755 [Hyphomicrobium nitrativorans NL23]